MQVTASVQRTKKVPATQIRQMVVLPVCSLLAIVAVAWIVRPLVSSALSSVFVTNSDLTLLHWFRSHSVTLLDNIFVFIALLGAPVTLAMIAMLGAVFLWRKRMWMLLTVWVEAFGGSSVLTVGIKHIYLRQRPAGATEFLHGLSFSFPSGHALGSLVAFSTIAYTLHMLHPGSRCWSNATAVGAPLLIFAVGLSRLYLGVHYLSDVLAGLLIGAVWATVCIVTLRKYR